MSWVGVRVGFVKGRVRLWLRVGLGLVFIMVWSGAGYGCG